MPMRLKAVMIFAHSKTLSQQFFKYLLALPAYFFFTDAAIKYAALSLLFLGAQTYSTCYKFILHLQCFPAALLTPFPLPKKECPLKEMVNISTLLIMCRARVSGLPSSGKLKVPAE